MKNAVLLLSGSLLFFGLTILVYKFTPETPQGSDRAIASNADSVGPNPMVKSYFEKRQVALQGLNTRLSQLDSEKVAVQKSVRRLTDTLIKQNQSLATIININDISSSEADLIDALDFSNLANSEPLQKRTKFLMAKIARVDNENVLLVPVSRLLMSSEEATTKSLKTLRNYLGGLTTPRWPLARAVIVSPNLSESRAKTLLAQLHQFVPQINFEISNRKNAYLPDQTIVEFHFKSSSLIQAKADSN